MHVSAAPMRKAVAVVATIAGLILWVIPLSAASNDIEYDVDLCAGNGQRPVDVQVQLEQGEDDLDEQPAAQ